MKLSLLLMTLIYLLFSPSVAIAQEQDDQYQLLRKGIYYYDPNGNAYVCAPNGNAAIINEADDVKSNVWNFLSSKELSAQQIAGLMGNLAHESGDYELNTSAIEGGSGIGYGLAQWSFGRKDKLFAYAQQNNKDPSDLALQLDYLWLELTTTEQASLNDLRRQTTVDEATKSFMLEFERPGIQALAQRIEYANRYYNEYQGKITGGQCSTTSTPGLYGWDLTGTNTMVYYAQDDPKWANDSYGSSDIETSGCGPTSVAMVIATLADKNVIPPKIATDYSRYYVPGSGSSWELFTSAPKDYGLKTDNIGLDFGAVIRTLQDGGLVIVSVGEGTFSSGGHIMVIRKVSEDGNTFYFADPYSENGRTKGESNINGYTKTEIVTDGNIRNMWSIYEPK